MYVVNDKLLVWGGDKPGHPWVHNNDEKNSHPMWVLLIRHWKYESSCIVFVNMCVVNDKLLVWGGDKPGHPWVHNSNTKNSHPVWVLLIRH